MGKIFTVEPLHNKQNLFLTISQKWSAEVFRSRNHGPKLFSTSVITGPSFAPPGRPP
ncbi:hypothetical protein KIN20_022132, partial [Parelaphostrongylus tenuis]